MQIWLRPLAFGLAFATALATGLAAAEGPRPLDEELKDAFDAGELPGLHAVLAVQAGKVLGEVYFPGQDERWGTPLGPRNHGPDELHDLRSVTKPIVGLLYGIALAEGKVPEVDAPLIAQFPGYADLAADPRRQAMRVEHALAMTMGTEWSEDLPYTDPRNSEIAMEQAEDRYRFVLDRPMAGTPGESWTYNGGAVAIVAKLLSEGTGMAIDAYARKTLFAPLGITEFEWVRGGDGEPSAASGLRLKSRDLAKIGQLIVQNGVYDGRQVVPADWLERSFTPRAETGRGLRYGYFWWLAPEGDPPAWVAGFGNGGQRLGVAPETGLVVVVFAGNYNQPDAWQLPVKILEDFVLPAAAARTKE